MTTTLCPDAVALHSETGGTWFDPQAPDQSRPLTWEASDSVTKIVIGTPPAGDDKKEIVVTLPASLAELYPNLTHLHLWQIGNLEQLPKLPSGLACLDVRGCEKLVAWTELPDSLETFVIEGSGSLPAPDRQAFPNLSEASFRGCAQIEEAWLHEFLRNTPTLRLFDASDCTQLTRIPVWPDRLEDIRLGGCAQLKALPKTWPKGLRRLGLRGAESVSRLPNFPPSIDYVDLANTRFLRHLPSQRGTPRTLFLYGSGVLEPPATEHGKSASENVAENTAAYFADRQLTGDGNVKRCKVLVLGNGGAGKTCLSLALIGRDPGEAQQLGSTHGIQFWDWGPDHGVQFCNWDIEAAVEGSMEPVHLHLWDFGGQEIYHNTHRLFMSKGAVFLLLWHPDQDGLQPAADQGEYQDEWRRLRYWLDFIHLACPHKPRVAIVCSHHAEATPELEARWRAEVPEDLTTECKCFYIDSLRHQGQFHELNEWLQDEVGEVVATQGSAVPSYWEVAQDLVESWVMRLASDKEFAATHNQLTSDQFREYLWQAITAAVRDTGETSFPKLRDAIDSGDFVLDDDRLRRTLNFLTNSGWVYWDTDLFQGRVIIGQKWALDGLYAILERRKESPTFRELCRADGRFSLSDLGRLAWDQMGFQRDEQRLLLSYMQQCGLCFKVRMAEDAWREEDIYISFEHLPTAKEVWLARDFERRRAGLHLAKEELTVAKLHKQHWQNLLTSAGMHYGKNAQYTADALLTENEHGQLILIRCDLHPSGLGGAFEIQIAGNDADARLSDVRQFVRQFLPISDELPTDGQGVESRLGRAADQLEVFVSYAWNPPASEGDSGIPKGYEEPVDEIERFLTSRSYRVEHGEKRKWVKLVRDKSVIRFGDSLRNFMQNGARRPHVIVVHSDKYWRSADCIFELNCLFNELMEDREKDIDTVLIPIEHLHSQIGDVKSRDQFLKFWRNYDGQVPARCFSDEQALKDVAAYVIRRFCEIVSDKLGLNIRWEKDAVAALSDLARRLNLPGPESSDDA